MIDLHGAPGSQNGFDNSGRRGAPANTNGIHFLEDGNVDRTLKVLGMITELISGWITEGHIASKTIFGIELANEPWGRVYTLLTKCFRTTIIHVCIY
jgi:glucan 1,3-beta-glucosidase